MGTSKREALLSCAICGDATQCEWHQPGKRSVGLCGACLDEMIEDFGQEFPEESRDDLLPDDFDPD